MGQTLSVLTKAELAALYTGGSASPQYDALGNDDFCVVGSVSDGKVLPYQFDADSGLAHNGDTVIAPSEVSDGVAYEGDGRWIKGLWDPGKIDLETLLSSDHTYIPLEPLVPLTATSGYTPAFGDVVVQDNSGANGPTYAQANATNAAGLPLPAEYVIVSTSPLLGMSKGYIRDDSWANVTNGNRVYQSTTPGVPTSTAPSATGNIVQVLGVGKTLAGTTSAKIIYWHPSRNVLRVR